jgi:dihydroorotate dehydrogenase
MRDVEVCSAKLKELNKVFIVSVMGDFENFKDDEDGLVGDYLEVAQNAQRAGAPIIELNLSCPNLSDSNDPKDKRGVQDWSQKMRTNLTLRIVETVRERLPGSTKLLVKFGALDHDMLEERLKGIIGYVDGVSGINALQYPVEPRYYSSRAAAFVPNKGDEFERRTCAVSGEAIRRYALEFVRHTRTIADALGKPGLEILAMGGVASASDVIDLRKVGATAVQSVTSAFYRPSLARDIYRDLARFKELDPEAWAGLERRAEEERADQATHAR